jgi:CBS domain containing-hemolysin-like protein
MSFYRSLGAKFQILLVVSLALLLGFFFLSTVSIAEVNNLHTKLGDKENYLLSFLIKMGISFVVVSALCVSAVLGAVSMSGFSTRFQFFFIGYFWQCPVTFS